MAQGKVSMVVACYNKVPYIDAMLQSVHDQIWDNLELILVNDGSTDGTLAKLQEWKPKLTARGYEVILIDQENGGVCAAMKAGLLCMTGDYYCSIDADDEIAPEYVSTMAGFLEENEEYEWASCAYKTVDLNGDLVGYPLFHRKTPEDAGLLLNNFFDRIFPQAWIYLARMKYVKKAGMVEAFTSERSRIHEQEVIVPLALANGRHKHFPKPLYHVRVGNNGISSSSTLQQAVQFYGDWKKCCLRQLDIHVQDAQERAYYSRALELAYLKRIIRMGSRYPDSREETSAWLGCACRLASEMLGMDVGVGKSEQGEQYPRLLFSAIERKLFRDVLCDVPAQGENYGYGVLGQAGQKSYQYLQECGIHFSLFWDIGAEEDMKIDGAPVLLPDESLFPVQGTVYLFPKKEDIVAELTEEFGRREKVKLLNCHDIDDIILRHEYKSIVG